jgi:hypothetical protein
MSIVSALVVATVDVKFPESNFLWRCIGLSFARLPLPRNEAFKSSIG